MVHTGGGMCPWPDMTGAFIKEKHEMPCEGENHAAPGKPRTYQLPGERHGHILPLNLQGDRAL